MTFTRCWHSAIVMPAGCAPTRMLTRARPTRSCIRSTACRFWLTVCAATLPCGSCDVPRKHRPPSAEQVARLQRELAQAWKEDEEEPVRAGVKWERTELDERVDEWLKEFLGE